MKNLIIALLCVTTLLTCKTREKYTLDTDILASFGSKHRIGYGAQITHFREEAVKDSTDINNYVGIAENNIIMFAFGFMSRAQTIPEAHSALKKAYELDSVHSRVQEIAGILNFMDSNWDASEKAFKRSLEINPSNLSARHWYTLYLMATKRMDEGVAQSDKVYEMDKKGDFLVARASIFYFLQAFERMKPLMYKSLEKDSLSPWTLDWLGMAYNGLEEHDKSLKTYFKAFNLSDGTVEVGGGLGHALGEAGEYKLGKEMADYYTEAAKTNYLPACQRAFIHLGIGENDEAMTLLEEAYDEKSWFLLFMQIEHWYDPIRDTERFKALEKKMNFPQ
jgi:tetratricopeptide (TPR) repeat protein